MIDRRRFVHALGAGIAMAPLAVAAQPPRRMPRIGVLKPGAVGSGMEILRQGLQELGYVERRTVVIEWRWWDGKPERLKELAAELVRLRPDVIVVGGSEATQAVKEATRTIPVVFNGPSYPVEEGLVESFARPGGNVTGITVAQSDFVAKLIELLRQVAPTLDDVGVIWSSANPGARFLLRDTQAAARGANLKLIAVSMSSAGEVEPALAELARSRPGALIVHPAAVPLAHGARIGEWAIRSRIPSITQQKLLAERGLLMSYGADSRVIETRVPHYVDRILKGARPADLPVERPTKFELAINMRTARTIGIVVPPSLRLRADTLIE